MLSTHSDHPESKRHSTMTTKPTARAARAIELLQSEGYSQAEPIDRHAALKYREIGPVTFAELVTLGWGRPDRENSLIGLSTHAVVVLWNLLPALDPYRSAKDTYVAELKAGGFTWQRRGIFNAKPIRGCGRKTFEEIREWAGMPVEQGLRCTALTFHVERLRTALRAVQKEHGPQVARKLAPQLAGLVNDVATFKVGRLLGPADAGVGR